MIVGKLLYWRKERGGEYLAKVVTLTKAEVKALVKAHRGRGKTKKTFDSVLFSKGHE